MNLYNKIILSGFALTFLVSALSFSIKSDNISDKLIRMHVLANSNSEYDQRIKIEVKDEVAAFTEKIIEDAKSLEEAEKNLREQMPNIGEVAKTALSKYEVGYSAEVLINEQYFGTRVYENFTLPAGDYLAVKVLLGEAEGENWWCVVYPSICVGAAVDDFEVLNKEEEELVSESIEVSFKIHEIYMDIKNYFSKDKLSSSE